MCSIFVGCVLRDDFQICFRVAVQNKLGIRQRVVIDEIVQLRPLEAVVCHLVFYGGAVMLPSANRSSTQPVSMLNAQLLIFFMFALLISFHLWFSRSSGFGFRALNDTVSEMRILKLLEINK